VKEEMGEKGNCSLVVGLLTLMMIIFIYHKW